MIRHGVNRTAEMFGSAMCNINCNYCYIPKIDCMSEIHGEIIDKIKSGEYFDDLYTQFGEGLQKITIWGGEPSFALPFILENAEYMLEKLPNLNSIWHSSNFISNAGIFLKFIREFPRTRPFTLGIQISIDGGPDITDVNRAPDATSKIVKNLCDFFNGIQDITMGNFKVKLSTKMTWGINNIEYLCNDLDAVRRNFAFCNKVENKFKAFNHPNVKFHFQPIASLALPGKYTSEDGKKWNQLCRLLYEIDQEEGRNPRTSRNSYFRSMASFISQIKTYYTHHNSKTCGAGNSMWQVGHQGDAHICHRTLFGNHPKYLQSIKEREDIQDTWNITNFDTDMIEMVNNKFVKDIDNQFEIDSMEYALMSYHRLPHFKLSATTSMIYILAANGQIDECFMDPELAGFFAAFIHDCLPCPTEYLMNTGSTMLSPMTLIRMFGNGAFQFIFEKTIEALNQERNLKRGEKPVFTAE